MIGNRIKEERLRLHMTQDDFARAANCSRRTLADWERGSTSPTAVQLSSLSVIGVDALYILTGKRSLDASLPNDEAELLINYRHCRPSDRLTAQRTLGALAHAGAPFNSA